MTATYSPATIKRCQTILRNASSKPAMQRKVRKAESQRVVQETVKADWRLKPASKAQLARINRAETVLGYRLSTARTIGNAGSASDLFQSLKAEVKAL